MQNSKMITKNQLSGIESQHQFAAFATQVNLLPNPIKEDFGFDFICQPLGESVTPWLNRIHGKFIAVSVRGTVNKKHPSVKITRKDAELFLSCDCPFLLALVHKHPKKGSTIYLRFPDSHFIAQLIRFLNSASRTLAISAGDCVSDLSNIRSRLIELFDKGYSEKTRHMIRNAMVENVFPKARMKIIQGKDGALTFIELDHMVDQFDTSSSGNEEQLIRAAFGHDEFLNSRLKHIPIKSKWHETAMHLPKPILIHGLALTLGDEIVLRCQNQEAHAECSFTSRYIKTHYGFYHRSGLALVISEARKHEGQFVHTCDCFIDTELNSAILDFPRLCAFLKVCIEDSEITRSDRPGPFLTSSHFALLKPLGHLVSYLEAIPDSENLKVSDWKLEPPEEEDLQSLRVLSGMYKDHRILNGFGFIIDESAKDDFIPETRRCIVPLCMNLKNKGIICWLYAECDIIWNSNHKYMIGIRIKDTQGFQVEVVDNRFPTGGVPEFKICSEWPGISMYMHEHSTIVLERQDWNVKVLFLNDDES